MKNYTLKELIKQGKIIPYDFIQNEDSIKCQICGGWFKSLHIHLRHKHDISPQDYKEIFGLCRGFALEGLYLKKKRQEYALRDIKNFRKNVMPKRNQYKKGDRIRKGQEVRKQEKAIQSISHKIFTDEEIKQHKIENAKRWKEKNPEKAKQIVKDWQEKNKERVKESQKKYRQNNKEKISEMRKQWLGEHMEECLEYQRRYQRKPEQKKRAKEYYKKNKEKLLKQSKKRYEKNREDILKRMKENYDKNKTKGLKV